MKIISSIVLALVVGCGDAGPNEPMAGDPNDVIETDGDGNVVTGTTANAASEPGPQGPQGVEGPQGVQGPQGLPGKDGATGPQGEAGPQGPIGTVGPMGPVGDMGLQGIQGDPGPQGTQGLQGLRGLQGLTGANGTTGLKGDKGDPGIGLDPTAPYLVQGVSTYDASTLTITSIATCKVGDMMVTGGCAIFNGAVMFSFSPDVLVGSGGINTWRWRCDARAGSKSTGITATAYCLPM